MSFVHCPSCHRAFDLRRHAGCPGCAARREPAGAAAGSVRAEPGIAAAMAAGEESAVRQAPAIACEPVAPVPGMAAPAPELAASAPVAPHQRIVALVSELAALVAATSTAELEVAQQQLARRGLAAPWPARLLAAGERRLGELVARAVEAPRQGARRVASRLRAVWSELGSQA